MLPLQGVGGQAERRMGMVMFNKTGFTVEVVTGINPQDNYRQTIDELISLLQSVDHNMRGEDNYYYLLELLRAMMPSEEQIEKIIA